MTEPGDVIRAEAGLRSAVRAAAGLTIVTGGQTGVDSEGAHAALRGGLQVHLIVPAGLRGDRPRRQDARAAVARP